MGDMSFDRVLKVGVAQVCSSRDPYENLLVASEFLDSAREQGVELLCFPENLFYRGPKIYEGFHRQDYFLNFESESLVLDSDFSHALKDFFDRSRGMAISIGSLLEASTDPTRPFNTHCFLQPDGRIERYRKMHLFDYSGEGVSYRESHDFSPGEQTQVVRLGSWNIALSICFDLRFPELYRSALMETDFQLLLAPAAFTQKTGEAHWELLLRARAVENLCYVAAAGQWGSHYDAKGQQLDCYGNSTIIDPWGQITSIASTKGDSLIIQDISMNTVEKIREKLPALNCRRASLMKHRN